MNALPPKDPRTTKWYSQDFADLLAVDETIDSVESVISYFQGATIDVDTDLMVTGDAVISGSQVSQLINGGFNGNTYIWLATATTSAGQILPLAGTIPVRFGVEK